MLDSASTNNAVNISNLEVVEDLYKQFKQSPASVSLDWQRFFEGVDFAQDGSLGLSEKELDVYNLIMAYRDYGHFEANLNPIYPPNKYDLLSLEKHKLSEKDLSSRFAIGKMIGLTNATLKEIVDHLRSSYCGTISVQVSDARPEVRNWFITEFEKKRVTPTAQQKRNIMGSLIRTEGLEKFIHTRYVGAKRFSVEGGDSMLPMLEHLAENCTGLKGKEIVIGMAHRGRVNVLANFMGKGLEYIFADFNGPTELAEPIDDFDGDVKYHLGYTSTKSTANGPCKISLAFNPSHLEAVNPVVLGIVRAAQRKLKDTQDRKTVIPVLIHGESAFASQGVNLETFQMAYVKGYTVGGSIHLVIDNQVGFTTVASEYRSSHYSSDVAKVLSIPVIHCNGDDAEASVRAMDLAMRYRQEFGKDIVINVVCYRRFGHNEGDEPAYTQPLMYDLIRKHPTVREIYGKKLVAENVMTQAEVDKLVQDQMDLCQTVFEATKKTPPKVKPFKFEGNWAGLRRSNKDDFDKPTDTRFDINKLKDIAKKISEVPAGFTPHPKLLKLLENRKNISEGKESIDWGVGELLAFGSLLMEGTSVRLTGEDCIRGTFTHRHAGLYDSKTNDVYMALDHLNSDKVEFCVYNSTLSEYAVLGFEYGNAISDPTFLTIWEAQFGDFANGAQIIIDQFLCAGEAKWQQMTGLVLLLPHGYEGQGPEHSSARLERFLQLCAQNNMIVVNLTTPAQIYHAMRRQMKREFRKPLIVMSPKSLLRHPKAVSSLEDLASGTFQEVIADASVQDSSKVESVVFVSGKLYYELLEEKEKTQNTKTALIRLEQLYPFPTKQVVETIKSFKNAKNVVWAQEEPMNMGAYQNVFFKFTELIANEGIKAGFKYAGRPSRSSPATGSVYRHKTEQADVIKQVFSI